MARRLHQTLADYLVIAISPALIMTLVGSLMFFLLRVFYQGAFQERLHWVMLCFVFASVLIARISIEDGFQRAAPFGAALAILVGIAANRFMEYHGAWIDSYSWIINFSVIGIVWWCVHQLTWDCTVIDEGQDSSGEGLMQIVGLERPGDERNAEQSNASDENEKLEGTTTREVPVGFWQRYVERQRRPHAPGVWVVYFSLAALPIFGLGQGLIPAADTAGRRYVFWLLCVYVASGLGLLLTTSFLGLRRYLRQRRIEMPTLMANLWLITGGAIILVLLVTAAILPRPSAEYAISELPISLGSPDNKASRLAPLKKEGTPDDQPATIAQRQEPNESDPDAPPPEGSGNQPGGDSQSQNAPSGDAGESAQREASGANEQSSGNGEPASGASGDASGQQGNSGSQQRQGAQQDANTPESQAGNSSETSSPSDEGSKSSPSPSGESGTKSAAKSAPKSTSPKSPPPKQPQDAPRKQGLADTVKRYRETQKELAAEFEGKPKKPKSEEATQQPGPEPEQSDPAKESPEQPPTSPHLNTLQPIGGVLGVVAMVLKLAVYVLLGLAVLYALWRYHREIWGAIVNFLAELRAWWQGLFGGRAPAMAGEDKTVIRVPLPPFASFADPFASGAAARYEPAELVRYSFEAFEAWSREHGCERAADQTPHELARDVARLNAHIATDARNLAELYARAAFARGRLPDSTAEQLRQLWRQMTPRVPAAR